MLFDRKMTGKKLARFVLRIITRDLFTGGCARRLQPQFITWECQMKIKRLSACLLSAPLFAACVATAQAEGTDLGLGLTLSGNLAVTNDYRFRGYTQTNFKPAVQGGIDLNHSSGFYLGNWNSNVGWTTGTSIEMGFYGGWKGDVGQGLELDLGAYQYAYPGADMAVSPNTTELYVGIGMGPASFKVYYAPSNYFGIADSKNTFYFDASGSIDLGSGWAIGLHAGYQTLRNAVDANGNSLSGYFDYKAGISKDISGWVFDLSVVGASSDDFFLSSQGHPAGRVGALFAISKGF
jgi:uncharacterized protein (TIGR02001 family)